MVPPARTPGTPVGQETVRQPEREWESEPHRAHPRASRSTRERVAWTQYKNGPGVSPGPAFRCDPTGSGDLADVLRLQALRTLGDIELDGVTLGETAETVRLDRREVDEHIRTRLLRDKAEALRVVEPLHLSLCHTEKPLLQMGHRPGLLIDPGHRDLGRAQTKTARLDGPRGAQTAGDGATYCLNRGQR